MKSGTNGFSAILAPVRLDHEPDQDAGDPYHYPEHLRQPNTIGCAVGVVATEFTLKHGFEIGIGASDFFKSFLTLALMLLEEEQADAGSAVAAEVATGCAMVQESGVALAPAFLTDATHRWCRRRLVGRPRSRQGEAGLHPAVAPATRVKGYRWSWALLEELNPSAPATWPEPLGHGTRR